MSESTKSEPIGEREHKRRYKIGAVTLEITATGPAGSGKTKVLSKLQPILEEWAHEKGMSGSTKSEPTVSVQPDYGKDDSNLQPGFYAAAHEHLAGPASTRAQAMKALAGYLWDEGHVMPGDDIEAIFFIWPPKENTR